MEPFLVPPYAMNSRSNKITCIMLTRNEIRRPFIQMAIRCFQRQTYTHKELLIINSGSTPIGCPDERVRELMVQAPTLGHLRNIGLEHVQEGSAITWDDDDWRHDDYLSALGNATTQNIPRSYPKKLNVNFKTGETYISTVIAVILFPITSVRYKYPEWNAHEDSAFMEQFPQIERIPIPENYYVRFYHGNNVCSRDHILSGRKTDQYKSQIADIIREIRSYETHND